MFKSADLFYIQAISSGGYFAKCPPDTLLHLLKLEIKYSEKYLNRMGVI